MEIPYQNREIKEMFGDVVARCTRIETQTTMHNSRMTKLEKAQAYMTGAVSVLTVIVIPILAWALLTLVNINDTIHKAVDQALSIYTVSIK